MNYPSEEARLLDCLGPDAQGVADFLKSQGIKGVRHGVRQENPICCFIQKHTAGFADIDVVNGEALEITFTSGSRVATILPPAVKQFLVQFNNGMFPDLILAPDAV